VYFSRVVAAADQIQPRLHSHDYLKARRPHRPGQAATLRSCNEETLIEVSDKVSRTSLEPSRTSAGRPIPALTSVSSTTSGRDRSGSWPSMKQRRGRGRVVYGKKQDLHRCIPKSNSTKFLVKRTRSSGCRNAERLEPTWYLRADSGIVKNQITKAIGSCAASIGRARPTIRQIMVSCR